MSTTEAARQRELDTYRIVDSLPEAEYDDIARIASVLCGTPQAVISLIDRDRQWFKARVGFESTETRRDEAICDHAIRTPELLMEIRDASKDARFAGNPGIGGVDGVRFYAGMPLVTPGGAAIGTVCVFDREPRTLTDGQRNGLTALARLTMRLLHARHREHEVQRASVFAADEKVVSDETPSTSSDLTIAIFEVQRMADAATRLGERAIGREIEQFAQQMEAALRPRSADSVSHVSGTGELTVLLHGPTASATLRALRDCAASFTRRTGVQVVLGFSDSAYPDEPLPDVYLRADEALTNEKNGLVMQEQAA